MVLQCIEIILTLFNSYSLFDLVDSLGLPRPRGIFQVGANSGQEIEMFSSMGVESAFLVEPTSEAFTTLKGKAQLYGFVAIKALVSDVPGERLSLNLASNRGGSSSVLKPSGHLEKFPHVKFTSTETFLSTTVDQLCEKIQLTHEPHLLMIDTLYLDVQGWELRVILGANKLLRQLKYIYLEHFREGLYEESLPLEKYIIHLSSLGFVLNNCNYNRAHHTDVLFINKDLLFI